jgi:hypothetical protein
VAGLHNNAESPAADRESAVGERGTHRVASATVGLITASAV